MTEGGAGTPHGMRQEGTEITPHSPRRHISTCRLGFLGLRAANQFADSVVYQVWLPRDKTVIALQGVWAWFGVETPRLAQLFLYDRRLLGEVNY